MFYAFLASASSFETIQSNTAYFGWLQDISFAFIASALAFMVSASAFMAMFSANNSSYVGAVFIVSKL